MTGLVILAAGESRRLGEPKQNLLHNGESLLQHAVKTAVDSACRPVIIILGAYAEEIQFHIKEQQIIICQNSQWQEGVSSSIRLGIKMLQQTEGTVSAAVLTVCDQPHVNTELITEVTQFYKHYIYPNILEYGFAN